MDFCFCSALSKTCLQQQNGWILAADQREQPLLLTFIIPFLSDYLCYSLPDSLERSAFSKWLDKSAQPNLKNGERFLLYFSVWHSVERRAEFNRRTSGTSPCRITIRELRAFGDEWLTLSAAAAAWSSLRLGGKRRLTTLIRAQQTVAHRMMQNTTVRQLQLSVNVLYLTHHSAVKWVFTLNSINIIDHNVCAA